MDSLFTLLFRSGHVISITRKFCINHQHSFDSLISGLNQCYSFQTVENINVYERSSLNNVSEFYFIDAYYNYASIVNTMYTL